MNTNKEIYEESVETVSHYTIEDFNFNLPEELIAQIPLKNRSASRLMVLDKKEKSIEDKMFLDILNELKPNDALVMNDTRVLPARLYGTRVGTGANLEVLLLSNTEGDQWETLIKHAKKAKVGTEISFGDGRLTAEVIEERSEGRRVLEFHYEGIFLEILEDLGEMPLPPYITEKLDTAERYQTVYAKENGSAAAPTAGLHFTDEVLKEIQERGIKLVFLTLHVGLGTFRPVFEDEALEDHKMHSEYYQLSKQAADTLNETKAQGGRVIAVGTTSIRTLETIANKFDGKLEEDSGWTDIFIKPGYTFQFVDAFLTNFHLPKSTLIMLVSAFLGRDYVMEAYEHAVEEKYRFFSFGDAMFVQ